MSQAIFDLKLEMPPISVVRVRVNGQVRWIAKCHVCRHRSAPRPLISAAVDEQTRHGRKHARTMLTKADHEPTNRVPAPLDAVYLAEVS